MEQLFSPILPSKQKSHEVYGYQHSLCFIPLPLTTPFNPLSSHLISKLPQEGHTFPQSIMYLAYGKTKWNVKNIKTFFKKFIPIISGG